ncbi:MAG: hypothetical protein ACYDB3_04430, partial [Acidimicrobiales bacterium]
MTSNGTKTLKKIVGAGAATAVMVLAPLGVALAGANPAPVAAANGASSAAASPGPQCQLFSPLEGGILQFETAWNAQAGSQGAPEFGAPSFASSGQLPDIAGQMAAGTGCPATSSGSPGAPSGLPSGPPSSGGGSGGPQCQLFSPLEGGIEQFEQAWNAQAGSQGAPEFGGKGPFPDIAAQMASGSGCPIGSSSGSPVPAPPSSGGGSSAPQCQLFIPLAGGIAQIEAAWNSGPGASGAPTFGNQIPDIAAQILSGSGCSAGTPSNSTSPSGGGNTPSSTGGQGGSSGGTGSATSPSGSSSGTSGSSAT